MQNCSLTDHSQSSHVPDKSKNYRRQRWVDEWLSISEFQPWLEKRMCNTLREQRAFCAACGDWLTNGKSEIEKHRGTKKHKKNIGSFEQTVNQRTQLATFVNSRLSTITCVYEMRMCCMLAENNLPIKLIDQLIATNRALHPSDDILKNVHLGKQKATDIIRDGRCSARSLCELV